MGLTLLPENAIRIVERIQMEKLKVKIKNVYGTELVYPVCEKSKLFANLTNNQTLTEHSRRLIKLLGYSFEIVMEDKKL